ncbi:MAG TPA: 50S ribosomal protein L25 [Polyangiales bacterium]|jgi:large subunit ribosomal protein L25|nr:50S ribosomal protein L25 [Polyangiales bacterium]
MASHNIATEARTETGKGANRQLRLRGLMPAVYYGPGREPQGLAVSPKELAVALSTELGRNALVSLKINGAEELAMVQDLQVHPVTRKPLHVDFYKIDPEKEIERGVPFIAEGKAKGVVEGGELVVIYRLLPLRAKPAAFPAKITVDVSPLEIGDHIKVKELKLPAGVTAALPPERNVVSCVTMRKRADEEEAAAAAAPGAAGAPAAGAAAAAPAAGAAAAPAAGAKPAAGDKKKG